MDFQAQQSLENKNQCGVTPVSLVPLPALIDAKLIALPWFSQVASSAFIQLSFLTFKLI